MVSPRSEATSDFVRVSSVASSLPAQTARYRRHVNVTLVSCIHRSHQLLHGSNDVSVYLTCLDCRHHAKWTHRTGKHIPAITGVAANGSSVVGKIAATTRMMCWYLLMVGITFCLDRVVHAPNGADACSAGSSFVDTFHVDLWNSRDNVEQRVQRGIRRNRVDLVQLGGQMTNPKDWKHSCQTSWTQKTSRTTTQTRNSVRSSKVTNAGRVLETNDSCSDRAEQEITISSGVCCRLGSGSASSWWKSVSDVSVELERVDYLAQLQSVLTETPFLCAREGKTGIQTNCVDTARLFGRSRCCKSLASQRLVQFLTSQTCLCPMRCVCGTFQFRKIRCTVVILSMMKRRLPFRQKRTNRCVSGDKKFPEKMRRAIIRIHTNLSHPQNSTHAKMISDAGGSEEKINCATRYPCSCVQVNVPAPSPTSCVSTKNSTVQ